MDGAWDMTSGRALDKLTEILESVDPSDRNDMLAFLWRRFYKVSTSTERSRKSRNATAAHIPANHATLPLHEIAEIGNATAAFPPAPPVVSSSSSFFRFWSKYPKHVGKGKAEESWKKLKCEAVTDQILEGLEKNREYIVRENGKYIPLPATWLNQKRWLDEPVLNLPETSLVPPKKETKYGEDLDLSGLPPLGIRRDDPGRGALADRSRAAGRPER